MSVFDQDKFNTANFIMPTKKISVPELKAFFPDDTEPEALIWEVKGMTGNELAIVNEAVATYGKTKAIIEAIASNSNSSLKKGLENFLNKSDDNLAEDLIRRHKTLQFGSVEEITEETCVRLAQFKPTIFYNLTNEIIHLTGDGASVGE